MEPGSSFPLLRGSGSKFPKAKLMRIHSDAYPQLRSGKFKGSKKPWRAYIEKLNLAALRLQNFENIPNFLPSSFFQRFGGMLPLFLFILIFSSPHIQSTSRSGFGFVNHSRFGNHSGFGIHSGFGNHSISGNHSVSAIMVPTSVADPGCISRIRIFSIPDPRST